MCAFLNVFKCEKYISKKVSWVCLLHTTHDRGLYHIQACHVRISLGAGIREANLNSSRESGRVGAGSRAMLVENLR